MDMNLHHFTAFLAKPFITLHHVKKLGKGTSHGVKSGFEYKTIVFR